MRRAIATRASFPLGSELADDRVCWCRWKTRAETCAVGSFPSGASALGVLDMAGNVAEWTARGFYEDDRAAAWFKARYVARSQ
jgi:formylglycine-generating enzyme required for sulfatase activity